MEEQLPNPPRTNQRWVIPVLIFIIFLLLGASAFLYFWAQKQEQLAVVPPPGHSGIKVITDPNAGLPPASTSTDVNQPPVAGGVLQPQDPSRKLGTVSWNEPIKLPNLRILPHGGDTATQDLDEYYKVGTFTNGPYSGGEVILVNEGCDGMCFLTIYHFVKFNGKYTLLVRDSDGFYADDEKQIPFPVDRQGQIPDLHPAEKFTELNGRLILTNDIARRYPLFFDSKGLTVAFADSPAGPLYTTVLGQESHYPGFGFYAKAPDSTVWVYAPRFDFVPESNMPEVTWSDGKTNTQEYTYREVGGCGASNYEAVVGKDEVDPDKDLTQIGTTSKGDIVYGYRDSNADWLKGLYQEYKDQHSSDTDATAKNLTYKQFLASKPIFFVRDPLGNVVRFKNNKFMPLAECAKPVIYLYPEQKTKVRVELAPQGGFTYTEPLYTNGWEVTADRNGKLTTSDGKVYPYLFWEGRGSIYQTPEKGFVVKAGEVHSFFEEKLTLFGLNPSERKDFENFWEPKFTGAPYYFITFMDRRTMDAIAPLRITPAPDTIIRILMDYKPLQQPIPVEGFSLTTPQRKGFTVVEWGGVAH